MNVQNLTIASPIEALPRVASPDFVMSGSSTRVVDLLGAIAKMRPDLPRCNVNNHSNAFFHPTQACSCLT
jgi:hypothetical protein